MILFWISFGNRNNIDVIDNDGDVPLVINKDEVATARRVRLFEAAILLVLLLSGISAIQSSEKKERKEANQNGRIV
jgi:hypothetical protein